MFEDARSTAGTLRSTALSVTYTSDSAAFLISLRPRSPVTNTIARPDRNEELVITVPQKNTKDPPLIEPRA